MDTTALTSLAGLLERLESSESDAQFFLSGVVEIVDNGGKTVGTVSLNGAESAHELIGLPD
jgi:bifunctional N-acetylglucosamine-1-phosphate-uridyltransferase/glucosamine-1-phosphate-acetyltransferase GlmU-like protein